ncbi:MAG: hypothetical protein ACTHL8_05255 [Burkholderiaceae bacterium]
MTRSLNGVQLLALGGAGLATFLAAAHLSGQASDPEVDLAQPARRAAPTPAPRPASGPAAAQAAAASQPPAPSVVGADRAGAIPRDTGEPFAVLSWVAPPPPPPKPVVVVAPPPAPPVAPPLPFAFVGMVEKGTPKPQAFLSRGDELIVVAQGDLLDNGTYRVDAVTPGQIALIHVPTSTRQVINLSGGSQ